MHPAMRRLISIFFLSLLLLQAIPVLHFFSARKTVFYSLIDEEKPVEKTVVEKKASEEKEFLALFETGPVVKTVQRCFAPFFVSPYTSPSLDCITPPPNA